MQRANFAKRLTALFLVFCCLFLGTLRAETLSPADRELLNKIQRASLQYFIRLSHKTTGLTKDSSRSGSPASIAATGFALAAIAIGNSRGWISDESAEQQLKKTLRTLLYKAEHKNGFFYHFLDVQTGKRIWNSEASSIDTALLVAGALLAAQYYPGTSIERMAREIYDRIEWRWMMNGTMLMGMGWKPESGFLSYYWDSYNEHLILQALAIGSATHPIPAKAWDEWLRNEDLYNDKRIIHSYSGSLFTYQFAQGYIDFSQLDDRGIDYAKNSRLATLANREYSLSFQKVSKSYSEKSWGLSASVGPGGYKAYGGKPGEGLEDGTIAPYAAIGSLVFTPKESLQAIRHFYFDLGENLYGYFGFKDAFNLDKNWWAEEYLGIDQGITVLMLENFLNDRMAWKKFMALKEIRHWIAKCDLAKKPQPEGLAIPAS